MNESDTRLNKINTKLFDVGWNYVPSSKILTEQSAYIIAPGRIVKGMKSKPKKADYLLEYKGKKLAVIEAKKDELHVSEGVEQAKLYADMLQIRYAYSTNGNKIWFIDMGVKNAKGEYLIPSKEHEVEKFPSPQELWQMTFPEADPWRDKFNECAFNRSERSPRYYQEIAINNVLNAVAKQQRRILLTMATGTGKTYTAFQICWKLTTTKWKSDGSTGSPRILFISDRNILADQATNDFDQFKEDAICRLTPKELKKNGYKVPKSRDLYFTIFQTMLTSPREQEEEDGGGHNGSDKPYYMQYPRNFFDFIIIDECHRGGANDESEWRKLMEYFESAYQLGMTATPRRKVNANTYKYFGDPVYSYSLKQGIDDGFLVPFRVEKSTSNIDTYRYQIGDKVEHGEIDEEREYREDDFSNGKIEIDDRDEHRVMELLEKIDPDEKTIVFCSSQRKAMVVKDFINKHKKRPASNYCERVTADDGEAGEAILRTFQDNEKLLPTILTTSYKLSTGVDARNVRNIVLMRPIANMVEFKQIIGRGTRLFDDKYYFTIYDFVGASDMFKDEDWDGDPCCPVCGNYPCTCGNGKHPPKPCPVCGNAPCTCPPKPCPVCGNAPCTCPPKPCPVCGNLPCTCDGGNRKTIIVKLSNFRKLTLYTEWEQLIAYGDEMISLEEFIQRLFGRIPTFFKDVNDLRQQWSQPESRTNLLNLLQESGFDEQKLNMISTMLKLDNCDLLDVLEYIAYEMQPINREQRVRIVTEKYVRKLKKELQKFDELILLYYAQNGFKELNMENLKNFIQIKYNSLADAKRILGMQPKEINSHYLDLQKELYSININISGNAHFSSGGNLIIDRLIKK